MIRFNSTAFRQRVSSLLSRKERNSTGARNLNIISKYINYVTHDDSSHLCMYVYVFKMH